MEISIESLINLEKRNLRRAGHCVRHTELTARDLILCQPTHEVASRGGQYLLFVDMLREDIGLNISDLA